MSNPDLTDVANWAKNNPELIKLNPELASMVGNTSINLSKHRNIRVTDPDGEKYDSGQEAADASRFVAGVRSGEFLMYKHHVPVSLPGGIRMVIDHIVVTKSFQVELYDTKAWDEKTQRYLVTPDWRNKQKLFQDTFGIKIGII